MPMVLVGTQAGEKANFMAVGWISRVNASPPMIMAAIGRPHYTNELIAKNRTFSVNIPGSGEMEKVDYCGLVSGKKTDKSAVYDVFYGSLKTAPMIKAFPVTMECRLVQAVELPTNTIFVGEIVSAFAEESCLTDGKPDLKKIDPFMLTMPDNRYWKTGEQAGKAWSAGAKLIKK